jgi:nicotinamidase-related amidase
MIYKIEPKKTALLIIDAQREYFDEDEPLYTPHAAKITENLVSLRKWAESIGALTIIVQHIHKADGSDLGRMGDFDATPVFVEGTKGVELVPELAPRETDIVIRKTRYSAFVGTNLDSILKSHGVDCVVISGLMTNYCSVSTARHAHDLDYKVVFVTDANAGPDMPDLGFGSIAHADVMRVVATSLAGGIADVVDTDEFVQHLVGRGG